MAAQKVYGVYAASWATNEDGKSDVTIDEVTSLAPIVDGNFQSMAFDADIYASFGWLENITEGINLGGQNLSLLAGDDSLDQGDKGVLTVKFPQRAVTGANTDDNTCLQIIIGSDGEEESEQVDGCVVSKIDLNASQQGAAGKNISFLTESVDGVTSSMAYSMTTFSY